MDRRSQDLERWRSDASSLPPVSLRPMAQGRDFKIALCDPSGWPTDFQWMGSSENPNVI